MRASTIIRFLSAVALCAGLALVGAGAAGASAAEPVSGQWVTALPCTPTGTNFYDPVSGEADCDGSTTWFGTWTGQTIFHAHGSVDLLTGDEHVTIEERLYGTTADGHRGELHFIETGTTNGATNQIVIDARILDGSADFAGATGAVRFTGTVTAAGNGAGTFTGSWTHPAYGASASSPPSPGATPAPAAAKKTSSSSARSHHRARRHKRSTRHRAHHRRAAHRSHHRCPRDRLCDR